MQCQRVFARGRPAATSLTETVAQCETCRATLRRLPGLTRLSVSNYCSNTLIRCQWSSTGVALLKGKGRSSGCTKAKCDRPRALKASSWGKEKAKIKLGGGPSAGRTWDCVGIIIYGAHVFFMLFWTCFDCFWICLLYTSPSPRD